MNRLTALSRIVAAVIAVGIVSTSLPAFANDSAVWFNTQKQILRQTLEQAPPVTFTFVGNSLVPSFVKPAQKFIVYIEPVDGPIGTSAQHVSLR